MGVDVPERPQQAVDVDDGERLVVFVDDRDRPVEARDDGEAVQGGVGADVAGQVPAANASLDRISTDWPRRRRDSSPQDYPRRGRVVAAIPSKKGPRGASTRR